MAGPRDGSGDASDGRVLPPVLLVSLSLKPGGVDVRILQTARALDAAGATYRVAVIEGTPLHERLTAEKLAAHPVARRRGDPRIAADLAALAREMGARVIDAHNAQSQYWSAAAAALADIPGRVATVHSIYRNDHADAAMRRRVHEGALRFCRAARFRFVAVSGNVERYLAGPIAVPPHRLVLSGNALDELERPPVPADIPTEAGWPRDAVILGMVGRLIPLKQHRLAIEAVARRVAQGERRLRLFIAGTGPEEGALRAEVDRLGLADFVHFAGFRSDVPELLARIDLLCLPSATEGLPFALLEAARQGVPAIASRLEGIAEVFADEETIFFIPPGDGGALETRLAELLAAPDRRRRVGAAARRMVTRELSVSRMTDGMLELYARAAGDRGGDGRSATRGGA